MKYDLREQKSKFNKEVLKENMNISDIRAVNIKINGIIRDFEIVILPNEHAKARVTYEVPHLEYSEKDLFKLTEINAMCVMIVFYFRANVRNVRLREIPYRKWIY